MSESNKPRRGAGKPSAGVVVVGSYNQDMVWQGPRFPQPGETRLARFSSGPGGKGFNQAVAAARLGIPTLFIAALGRDALGDAAAQLADAEGIDARWLRVAGEATGTAAIWLDSQAQNMIMVAPGANTLLSPAHVMAQTPSIQAARVLLTQHEVHPVATQRAMETAAAAQVLRIHNPAPPLDGGKGQALLALADVLTPNESEFAALLATQGETLEGEQIATMDDASLHALCRRLPCPSVVITLGAAGVFVSHADPAVRYDETAFYRLAAEKVHPVDTTGAGDAFNGGLAASLAASPEAPFRHHLRQAIRVAGCAIEAHGAALAMPHRDELRKRFPD